MQAHELKLKNLVEYPLWNNDGTSKIWMVRDIFWEADKIGLTDGVIQIKTDFKNIRPIPITEEWLFKIETIKESNFFNSYGYVKGWYIGENEVCIVYFESKFYTYEMTDGENWGYVCNQIQFIHELQNYVYWHNNSKQELTFKTK